MTRPTCLILGSGSDIGQAIAYAFSARNFDIILAARTVNGYQQRLASDIAIRHNVTVSNTYFDGQDFASHPAFINNLKRLPDVVISVFGYLGDHEKATTDFEECNRIIGANFTGHVSLLNLVAERMKARRQGSIIGITSVAGDRGRQSNYLYGSAKAGFATYLSGLRNALCRHNVHVATVKPGFVRTKMIDGLTTPKALTTTPEIVAKAVWKAFHKGRNTVYVLPIWRTIMSVIRLIPEPIFKRLKL